MKKYMNLLTKKIEVEIANIIPENFAIIFDRWSNGSTHYVALFVSYPNNASENEYSTALIAFSPIGNETEFTAKAHFEYLSWVLQNILRKNMTNVTS